MPTSNCTLTAGPLSQGYKVSRLISFLSDIGDFLGGARRGGVRPVRATGRGELYAFTRIKSPAGIGTRQL